MDIFLIPNDSNTSWRFASTEGAAEFFFRGRVQLKCQARAVSTDTKTCSRRLVKEYDSILALLQSISTIAVPSNELGKIILALSDIALCNGKGHKGAIQIHHVRSDWCAKLRARYTLDTNLYHDGIVQCQATWDRHGSPSCWMAGPSSQDTQLCVSIKNEPFYQIQSKEETIPTPHQSTSEYTRTIAISSLEEQIQQGRASSSTTSSDIAYVDSDNLDLQATVELPFRSKSKHHGDQEETTRQIHALDTHPAQQYSTPSKNKGRPELHRSDIRTVTPPSFLDPIGISWADESPITPDTSGFTTPPEFASSPLSARSGASPIFDEPDAYTIIEDTPLTDLAKSSPLWGSSTQTQLAAESPSTRHWKLRKDSPSRQARKTSDGVSTDEDGQDSDSEASESQSSPVVRRLFANNRPKNVAPIRKEANTFGSIRRRAQTLPIHNFNHYDPKWVRQLPKRRHSIHDILSHTLPESNDVFDSKNRHLALRQQRRDSLPQSIKVEDFLRKFDDESDELQEDDIPKLNDKVLQAYDKTDDLDNKNDNDNDDDGVAETVPSDYHAHLHMSAKKTKVHDLYAKITPLPDETPTYQPFQQPTDPVRAICIKMRDSLNSEMALNPGYVYCYQRSCQPGHIKIGHVRVSQDQYKRDLATGSAVFRDQEPIDGGLQRATLPKEISQRMKEWKWKCRYEPQVMYWSPIPFSAFRMEKLVHHQLMAYRKKELKCNGCQKGHKELFEVDLQVAKRAVNLWRDFAELRPYYSNGALRKVWADRTWQMVGKRSKRMVDTLEAFIDQMSVWVESDRNEGSEGLRKNERGEKKEEKLKK